MDSRSTPTISHAILCHNRGLTDHLADGIVITPSHNPPEDGGFKYNPATPNMAAPPILDITGWVQNRANELLASQNSNVKESAMNRPLTATSTHSQDFAQGVH